MGKVSVRQNKSVSFCSAALCGEKERGNGREMREEESESEREREIPQPSTNSYPAVVGLVYAAEIMVGARAPIPPVSLPDNVVLMEDMALYAETIDLQGMMQEYLRR